MKNIIIGLLLAAGLAGCSDAQSYDTQVAATYNVQRTASDRGCALMLELINDGPRKWKEGGSCSDMRAIYADEPVRAKRFERCAVTVVGLYNFSHGADTDAAMFSPAPPAITKRVQKACGMFIYEVSEEKADRIINGQ